MSPQTSERYEEFDIGGGYTLTVQRGQDGGQQAVYLHLTPFIREAARTKSYNEAGSLNVDYDSEGNPIGLEIL